MNLAEALLAADAGKVMKKATKDFEVKRLSGIIGEPFVLHLCQIPSRRVREIQDGAVKFDRNNKPVGADTYKLQIMLLVDGITNKDFDSREVLKHYGAGTRKDLFEKLFNAGEIADIAEQITELCGFGGEQSAARVEEVKLCQAWRETVGVVCDGPGRACSSPGFYVERNRRRRTCPRTNGKQSERR